MRTGGHATTLIRSTPATLTPYSPVTRLPHDIGHELYVTSPELDIQTAELVSKEHENHPYALSEVVPRGGEFGAGKGGLLNWRNVRMHNAQSALHPCRFGSR